MKKLNQILSVLISAAIAITAAPWQVYALETAAMPEFVKTFTPPTRLGYVVDSFKGTSAQPIVLIQDLHANFGVQQKIVGMLKMFQKNAIQSQDTMVIGAEGASGPVDVSYVHNQDTKVRTIASNALLKEAEIAAGQHFAINSDKDVALVGIEDAADYKLHLALVRNSIQARMKLAAKIQSAQDKLNIVKTHGPQSLTKIWKAEDSYVNGDIGLDQLARVLHLPAINSYEEVERLLLSRKLEVAGSLKQDAVFYQNLVNADHYLNLMNRLFRQQMTLEEVQYVAQNLDGAMGVVMAVLPNEDAQEWKETIRTAIDYYAVALMRDGPLAENAIKLTEQYQNQPVFVITGGFHTAGIEKILASKNISYVTIAPIVESHTLKDEMLYLTRLLGVRADLSQIDADVRTQAWPEFLPEQPANTSAAPDDVVRRAVDDSKNPGTSGGNTGGTPTPTTLPVEGLQTPEEAGIAPADVEALRSMISNAFEVAPGVVGLDNGTIAEALRANGQPTHVEIVFSNDTAIQPGGSQSIAHVVADQAAGVTRIVVNNRAITALNAIRAIALSQGASAEQAAVRVQNAALTLALSETAVVATGNRGEQTALAARLGWFGRFGSPSDRGHVNVFAQGFLDLGAVTGQEIGGIIASAITDFGTAAHAGPVGDSTIRTLVGRIIEGAQTAYNNTALFNEAIHSETVKALFNADLLAKSAAAGAELAADIRGIGGAAHSTVSNTLARIGMTPEQNTIAQSKIDAIVAGQA